MTKLSQDKTRSQAHNCIPFTQHEVPSDNTPPKQATSWHRFINPKEVPKRIFQWNTKHFGSAHETSFTVPPTYNDFNWSGTSKSHSDTLSNNPPTYNCPLINKRLRRTAKIYQQTTSSNPCVTLPQLVRRFRRWIVSTSTSPSRRHLGHY